MKEVTISKKDLAPKVAFAYANTDLTMQDIAQRCESNKKIKFKMTASVVSNMLYYCIFHEIVSPEIERLIAGKIAANMKRHCKLPLKNPNTLYRKYHETLKDRKEFHKINEKLKLIEEYENLFAELEIAKIDLTDFISSEDERFYIRPRKEENIERDIKAMQYLLSEEGIDPENLPLEGFILKRIASSINGKYKI